MKPTEIVGAIDCRISAQRAQNAAAGHLIPIAIQGNLVGRNAGGLAGVGVSTEGASYTLTKEDVHSVAFRDVSPTLTSRMQGSSGWAPVNEDAHLVGQPVPFRKSKRAKSTTDDESWVEAEQANTMNAFDTGERDTHAIVHSLPDDPKPPADQVCIECDNDLAVAENWHCLKCLSDDPKLPTMAHGFYSTGGTHGLNHIPEVSPAVKVGSGLGIPSPPAVAFSPGNLKRGAGAGPNEEVFPTLKCSAGRGADDQRPCVAIGTDCYNGAIIGDVAATMTTQGSSANASGPTVMEVMTVRRLTPRECERLQAFPDDYTMIPWRGKSAADCPDGPRYKALGNSMAVNCMEWIGERIAAYEDKHR